MKSKIIKNKKTKTKIDKKDKILDIIRKNKKAGKIFFEEGLSCVGCPVVFDETLEEGCLAHGLDVDEVLKKINKKLKKN